MLLHAELDQRHRLAWFPPSSDKVGVDYEAASVGGSLAAGQMKPSRNKFDWGGLTGPSARAPLAPDAVSWRCGRACAPSGIWEC